MGTSTPSAAHPSRRRCAPPQDEASAALGRGSMPKPVDVWLAAGVRTPFAKVDGPLQALDALQLSVPVARHMVGLLNGGRPDFAVWGAVVPSLLWSNIAREVLMDAGIDATTPAFSTIMACSTSMI